MDDPLFPPPPPPPSSSGFNLNNRVSPNMLLIIIILAVIFFISGVLHLLVRFLLRPPARDPGEIDTVTALQGQLQQLFHLHDAGVDQSFIDALPVFNYKAIIGVKDPFDCAVCLCEFEPEDKLRLLPKCSHAFHMDCIDTWLLSHSTCPLCRATLLADFPASCSPLVLVLESGSETSREIVPEREPNNPTLTGGDQLIITSGDEIEAGDDVLKKASSAERVVVSVKLGKFRSTVVNGGGEEFGSTDQDSNAEARRCFSMGSFAYVMDENLALQVPIRTPMKKQSSKKQPLLPLKPGHRPAMSECGCDSRRDLCNGFDQAFRILGTHQNVNIADHENKSINGGRKKESFSVSKIWMRGIRKDEEKTEESSRRAVSFRFPMAGDELKVKSYGQSTVSGIEGSARWENGGSDQLDEEIRSCNSFDSQGPGPPSFARRTLLWIMGRPNKVVHSSSSSMNV